MICINNNYNQDNDCIYIIPYHSEILQLLLLTKALRRILIHLSFLITAPLLTLLEFLPHF